MPELCLSYAGTARLPQGPRRPSSGQRSAHPLPSWPFTSCILHPLASLNSQLSALGSYSPRADLSRCLFTPLLRRLWLALSVFASLRSLCVSLIFFFFTSVAVSLSLFRPVAMQLFIPAKDRGQQDLISRTNDWVTGDASAGSV